MLEAVEHAHANLIVHRDIKPANVLVTIDGQVKLLDFGVAKLLEGDAGTGSPIAAAVSELTREAGAAMTPAFAAPEQMTGGRVTTATDVYALGVLLYVLLTGRHPAGDDLRSTAVLVQAIVDGEPRKVSDVVMAPNGLPDAPARYAASRGTTPQRLRRRLHGDLDVIVAKALKKAASERYASVTALADDVRRSLHREPISARPDTLWYRASSFVRRHRAGVSATAAVVLLIAGLTAFYTTRLTAERDRARLEAEKAAKVSELLTGLLTGADPYATRETRGEPTVRALLDAGAARLEKELEGQPELQAEIMTVMGRVYQRLGLHDKARPLLERALALGRQTGGHDHVRVAQSLNDLGVLLRERGDAVAAMASLEEALAMRRRLFGEMHKDVAVTLVELARAHTDRGRLDLAEPLLRQSLAIRRKVLGEWHRNTGTSMSDLGMLLWRKGDTAGAEAILRQTMTITRVALAEDHPDVATALSNLALIEQDRGDHEAAIRLLTEALTIHRRALGRHWRVAGGLDRLAISLREQRRYAEAEKALDEAVDIARDMRGEDHPYTAAMLVSRARLELARESPRAAEPLLRRALDIQRRAFPGNDTRVATTESLLGGALVAVGRYPEAEPLLLHARGVLDQARGRSAREAPATRTRLARLYGAWHHPVQLVAFRSAGN